MLSWLWSNTSYSQNTTYTMHFDLGVVYFSRKDNRYTAFPLRCLARQYIKAKAECDVRSGYASIQNARHRYAGIAGYGWSSRANVSEVNASYDLDIDASRVNSSYSNTRWHGFPLRCLARQ